MGKITKSAEEAAVTRKAIGPADEMEMLECQSEEFRKPEISAQYAVAANLGLNLREKPSKAAPIVVELPFGVGLFVTGMTQGPWWEVTTGNLKGWVLAEYLKPVWNY